MSVAFVFSNPRHHLEMMKPVADELEHRGIDVELVSLAELRGFDTPRDDNRIRRAIPINVRRRRGSPASSSDGANWRPGTLAQRVVWAGLGLRMRHLLSRASVVVVPNDAVYPYVELLAQLHARGRRSVLMQEGIRFPLPSGYHGPVYGAAATTVCAWGEGSKDYFVTNGIPGDRVAVTGAPRLDALDPAAWRDRGAKLLVEHAIPAAPIAFLSNPIEYQGYGDKQLKLSLFESFLAEIAPIARARTLPIVVKNHLHEDPSDYARIAARSSIANLVKVFGSAVPVFATLAAARAAIVLTSTVGLEALVFGVPIAVLEIPNHELAFEYVQRGAATLLRNGAIGVGVGELLDPPGARRAAEVAFVERHLHDRGRARYNVAAVIERMYES